MDGGNNMTSEHGMSPSVECQSACLPPVGVIPFLINANMLYRVCLHLADSCWIMEISRGLPHSSVQLQLGRFLIQVTSSERNLTSEGRCSSKPLDLSFTWVVLIPVVAITSACTAPVRQVMAETLTSAWWREIYSTRLAFLYPVIIWFLSPSGEKQILSHSCQYERRKGHLLFNRPSQLFMSRRTSVEMIYLTLGDLVVSSPEEGHSQRVHVHLCNETTRTRWSHGEQQNNTMSDCECVRETERKVHSLSENLNFLYAF